MMRRCFAPTAVLAATFILAMDARTDVPTPAPSIRTPRRPSPNYRLTVNGGLPVPDANIAGPQVVAMVAPAGGVVPPTNADGTQGSPLTVLSDSTGFDPSQLVVALKDATSDVGRTGATARPGLLRQGPRRRRRAPLQPEHRQGARRQPADARLVHSGRHHHRRLRRSADRRIGSGGSTNPPTGERPRAGRRACSGRPSPAPSPSALAGSAASAENSTRPSTRPAYTRSPRRFFTRESRRLF